MALSTASFSTLTANTDTTLYTATADVQACVGNTQVDFLTVGQYRSGVLLGPLQTVNQHQTTAPFALQSGDELHGICVNGTANGSILLGT